MAKAGVFLRTVVGGVGTAAPTVQATDMETRRPRKMVAHRLKDLLLREHRLGDRGVGLLLWCTWGVPVQGEDIDCLALSRSSIVLHSALYSQPPYLP